MTASLLLLLTVLVGASMLLFATTPPESVIGLRRSDRWPWPSDIQLAPLVVPPIRHSGRGPIYRREEAPCTSAWERSC